MNGWTKDSRRKFRAKRRAALVEMKGARCERCGFSFPTEAFDFHHRNPKTKKFKLTKVTMSATSWNNLVDEANKCSLLCSNCHRSVHANKEKGYFDEH